MHLERNRVTGLTSLLPTVGRIEVTLPYGVTINDAVNILFPQITLEHRRQVRVTFGGYEVPYARWCHIKPKVWDTILIQPVPGAISDLFRTILLVAVTIAAIAVGQLWVGPAIAGALELTGAAAQLTASLATAGLTMGGAALINWLVPPSSAATTEKQVFAIDGLQNALSPNGPVPIPLGTIRFAPPFAVFPFTEIIGIDQYITAIFMIGFSPITVSDLRIGSTEIASFKNVESTIISSYHTGDTLPFYGQQVIEERLSIAVKNSEVAPIRQSAKDTTEIAVDLFFPAGAFLINQDGNQLPVPLNIVIQQRAPGGTFATVVNFSASMFSKIPFWKTFRWTPPSRGQWEVLVARATTDDENVAAGLKFTSNFSWVSLKSYRPEAPLNYNDPITIVCVRIKANGQLNGILDNFNVLAKRIAPDWDTASSTWITRETQNPAALARYVRQGTHNALPDPDARLDLVDWQAWSAYCSSKGLRFNAVYDQVIRRDEAFQQVAHAGRALPYKRDGKVTVIVDKPRTVFYDTVSPRTSWDLIEAEPTTAFPDAISVKFLDESNSYVPSQRIVPWPAFIGDPLVIEEWPQPGKTDPNEIWIETRRRQYESIYRNRNWKVNQDFQHLVVNRGEAGYLSHYVINRKQSSGRVRVVNATAGMVEFDFEVLMEAGQIYQCLFTRSDNTNFLTFVVTVVGRTRIVKISGGTLPAEGDHVVFGRMNEVVREVVVQRIDRGDNFSAQLTLIPHAPEIETLTDTEVPPPWDGRFSDPLSLAADPPATPDINSITAVISGSIPNATGTITINAVYGGEVTSFEIDYRHLGDVSWITLTVPAETGSVEISGLTFGDVLEIRARAISSAGTSPDTATVVYIVHVGPLFSTEFIRFDTGTLTWDKL